MLGAGQAGSVVSEPSEVGQEPGSDVNMLLPSILRRPCVSASIEASLCGRCLAVGGRGGQICGPWTGTVRKTALRHPLVVVSPLAAQVHGTVLPVVVGLLHLPLLVLGLDPLHHVEHVRRQDGEGHGSQVLPDGCCVSQRGLHIILTDGVPGVVLPVLLHPLHDGLVRVVWDGDVVGAGSKGVTKGSSRHHVEAGEGGGVVEARAGVVHLFSLLLTSGCDSHLLHLVIEGARWDIELLTHLERRFSFPDFFNGLHDIVPCVLFISLPFQSLSWHIAGNASIMFHLVFVVILEAPLVASVLRAVSWNERRDGDLLVAAGA